MKKRLNLILNGKGGVGKSFFATHFVQYLKDEKIPHLAFDTDDENSTLKRFHPDARFIPISQPQEFDGLFSALEQERLVVVDGRAASTDLFLDYFDELNAFEVLESLGVALTVISPIGHDLDSVEQIKTISNNLEKRCKYLLVKNQALAQIFPIFDASKTKTRLLDELAAQEIIMPKLAPWLVTMLNQINLPVGQAILHPSIGLMDQQRLKNWQRAFYEQIKSVGTMILPGDQ